MDQTADHKKEHSKGGVIEIPVGKAVERLRKNIWMFATLVLVIVLVIVIFMKSGSSSGAIVSGEVAGKNLVAFINSQGNSTANVVSAVKEGQLYKVTVSYQGQNIPVFVSLDGKYFLPSAIPLTADASADNGSGNNSGKPVNIPLDDSPVIGNPSAKVVVVEFSDFSCPFCQAASGDNAQMSAYMKQRSASWEPIVTNLMKDYVATGKVLFVSKYSFGHTGGHSAQSVGWCLNDQNSSLFWKFYSIAYSKTSEDVENLTLMQGVAKTLGANMTKLQSCLDSKKFDSQFDRDQKEASAAGVSGTPAFFVNGQLIEGAAPYSQIKQLIDAELSK